MLFENFVDFDKSDDILLSNIGGKSCCVTQKTT